MLGPEHPAFATSLSSRAELLTSQVRLLLSTILGTLLLGGHSCRWHFSPNTLDEFEKKHPLSDVYRFCREVYDCAAAVDNLAKDTGCQPVSTETPPPVRGVCPGYIVATMKHHSCGAPGACNSLLESKKIVPCAHRPQDSSSPKETCSTTSSPQPISCCSGQVR